MSSQENNITTDIPDSTSSGPIRIDVEAVVKARMPRHSRFIPRWLLRKLAKLVCQDEMNRMLMECHGLRDADFCRGVVSHLDIRCTVRGEENLENANRRSIFVCNHPLGGLDGMIIIDYLSRRFGPGLKFIVNDLLMAIEPLSGVFLPINKHGRQSRHSADAIERAMAGPDPIVIFPAGLVSRKGSDGTIADLEWQKNFINKAIAHRRDVIPMFFSGENSKFFYNFAKLRSRLGLKFNIEMIRLPREVFLSRGREFSLFIGAPVSHTALKGGSDARETADRIRHIVYSMKPQETKR